MLEIVAVGVVRDRVPKIFSAPMYRAHCAVIFAIAQLSCYLAIRLYEIYEKHLFFGSAFRLLFSGSMPSLISET